MGYKPVISMVSRNSSLEDSFLQMFYQNEVTNLTFPLNIDLSDNEKKLKQKTRIKEKTSYGIL